MIYSNLLMEASLNLFSSFENINNCDAVIICVPTPLDLFQKPNMRYIEDATC